jgi:hypothetical protein
MVGQLRAAGARLGAAGGLPRVGRGEDDDAAAPCAPKALARALYVFFIFYIFLFSMYYISNKKKNFASGSWVHPTTHPDKAELAVRGPTHTDQIRPIRCPKWVDPLEMPLDRIQRVDFCH